MWWIIGLTFVHIVNFVHVQGYMKYGANDYSYKETSDDNYDDKPEEHDVQSSYKHDKYNSKHEIKNPFKHDQYNKFPYNHDIENPYKHYKYNNHYNPDKYNPNKYDKYNNPFNHDKYNPYNHDKYNPYNHDKHYSPYDHDKYNPNKHGKYDNQYDTDDEDNKDDTDDKDHYINHDFDQSIHHDKPMNGGLADEEYDQPTDHDHYGTNVTLPQNDEPETPDPFEPKPNPDALYNQTDAVNILDYNNFDHFFFNQAYAQILQFYDHKDVRSQKFASGFKKVVKKYVTWQKHLQFGVIDCGDQGNDQTCSTYGITKKSKFPSLIYVHSNVPAGDKSYLGDKIDHTKNFKKDVMATVKRFSNDTDFEKFFKMYDLQNPRIISDGPEAYIIIIFEEESSTVGPEIGLGLSLYENVEVQRGYSSSALAKRLEIKKFPAAVGFTNCDKFSVPSVLAQGDLKTVLDAIKDFIFLSEPPVTYTDLENAIRTSLHEEVASRTVTGDSYHALQEYIQILIDVFPARGNFKPFLGDLKKKIREKDTFSSQEITDLMISLEKFHYPVYQTSNDAGYVFCRGSRSRYRGYPCAFWSLFHTLLSHALFKDSKLGSRVVSVMYEYVKSFFKCKVCVQNFVKMMDDNRWAGVEKNADAIYLLWYIHNIFNSNLRNAATADPEYPKIIYPSADECPVCRQREVAGLRLPGQNACPMCRLDQLPGNIPWFLPAVKDFLNRKYGPGHIK